MLPLPESSLRKHRDSYQLQFISLELHGSGLCNEIKPQKHRRHPVTLFYIPLNATQRARFHLNPSSEANGWRQEHLQLRLQSLQDIRELSNELCLVMNFQQIGHMAILKHPLFLLRLKLEEYVTRKQGFLKRHGLPPVLVHGSIAREGRQNSLSFAALFQLLLSPWTRVRHEQFQITHRGGPQSLDHETQKLG